jgi:hypothetical protein
MLPSWLYTVKDRAFSSEHEWRLVLLPSVGVGGYAEYCNPLFRSGKDGPDSVYYSSARPEAAFNECDLRAKRQSRNGGARREDASEKTRIRGNRRPRNVLHHPGTSFVVPYLELA